MASVSRVQHVFEIRVYLSFRSWKTMFVIPSVIVDASEGPQNPHFITERAVHAEKVFVARLAGTLQIADFHPP